MVGLLGAHLPLTPLCSCVLGLICIYYSLSIFMVCAELNPSASSFSLQVNVEFDLKLEMYFPKHQVEKEESLILGGFSSTL